MTQRQAILIVGPAWSGSSVLNALLNTQPGVLGLGEACHWRDASSDAWCSRCSKPISECETTPRLEPRRLLSSALDAHPDKHTVVDASKHWSRLVRDDCDPEWDLPRKVLLLHKTPHAWTYSAVKHNNWAYGRCFTEWMRLLKYHVKCLERSASWEQWRDPHPGFLKLRPEDIFSIMYDELMTDPFGTLERICGQFELQYDRDAAEAWFRTATCIVGGNNAVYAQFTDDSNFWKKSGDYLDGKYAGRQRQLFLDEKWRDDPQFRLAMPDLYRQYARGVTYAAKILGMPWVNELIADVERPPDPS